MTLKSIDQHNDQRRAEIEALDTNNPSPSGIACPECGAEMRVDMSTVYTSDPPQRLVVCWECKFIDYIVA
jgi:hypothetical protein